MIAAPFPDTLTLAKNPAVAFFDLDGTITNLHSAHEITYALKRANLLTTTQVLLVVWGFVKYHLNIVKDYAELQKMTTRALLTDQPRAAILQTVRKVYEDVLRFHIYPEARQRLHAYHEAGWKIVIISSTYQAVVEPFLQDLPVTASYASELQTQGQPERFTGEVNGVVYNGETKADVVKEFCLQHGIDPLDCHAYGDHFLDNFMLSSVGHAFVVNPNRRFRAFALAKGYTVLTWNL
ncbi:MAG TPA: HAD-IB family hydrolase [Candidatus Ozemobacteraceae bacterium]|nr:HAD-IB family hydrolase [Candidatus Ozemobacteraceae bacterium]